MFLPSFIWKKLVGERVSWSKDYVTVDAAEVSIVDTVTSDKKKTHWSDEWKVVYINRL